MPGTSFPIKPARLPIAKPMPFSDYIVFADESGSPALNGADPDFPVFVLACVLVRKQDYMSTIVPAIQALKFDFVGHDQIVLHERDIRRQQKDFAFLQVDPVQRAAFLERVSQLVELAPMRVVTAVINKVQLAARYVDPWSPYQIAMYFCMERILEAMLAAGEDGKRLHVIFEARGANEDRELELVFRRIAAEEMSWEWKRTRFSRIEWEPRFVSKVANTSGLQLADLIARPCGLKALRPGQSNRAYDVIAGKIGFDGFKQFP